MERKLRNINRRAVHIWSLVLFKYHPKMIREARGFVDFTVGIIERYWSCLDYRTALQLFSLGVETCTCTTMLASDCAHGMIGETCYAKSFRGLMAFLAVPTLNNLASTRC